MQENDAEKYILEQVKIEVEHFRSWPTKVMAFYVAINFGLIGVLIALKKAGFSFALLCCVKVILALLLFCLSGWVVFVLAKNHKEYLIYRNIQIVYQKQHLEENYKEKYGLPEDWFKINKVCLSRRFSGWGFYLCLVGIIVTLLVVAGISFVI